VEASTVASGSARYRDSHGWRIAGIWAISSVVLEALYWVLLAPHMPPGNASNEAADQTLTNNVLSTILIPIMALIWAYFGYVVVVWRRRPGDLAEGPFDTGNARVEILWLAVTTAIVLGLAGYGTVELLGSSVGSGGGQGASPLVSPGGYKLQVQVIAQQWDFTFRYPQYGGIETQRLMIPENTWIEFHVTSLDVAHSFNAYQLGVKADAYPGVDNIAFVKTKGPSSFNIRCFELCGIWHGYMFDTGRVVAGASFASWIQRQRILDAPVMKLLPPYAPAYVPSPSGLGG
jgi:cytochrome c oxidase subunit II